MRSQAEAVLVGTIASIVLVPVVRFVWQHLTPGSSGVHLTPEAHRRNAATAREALVVALACLGLWALGKGFATEVGALEVATAMGIILGVPLWWILIRTRLRSKEALAEYGAYIESNDGISFRSLCVVAVVATAVATVCGLISYVQGP